METNIQATKQVIILKKIMEIENCSFSTAIDIVDRLKKNDLLNVYIYEMHGDIFNDTIFNNL
jgi:cobalamin biosynthesis Co2+ chelatase CbiK